MGTATTRKTRWMTVVAALAALMSFAIPGTAAGEDRLVEASTVVPLGEIEVPAIVVPGSGEIIPGTHSLCFKAHCVTDDVVPGHRIDELTVGDPKQLVLTYYKEEGTEVRSYVEPFVTELSYTDPCAAGEPQTIGGVKVTLGGTASGSFLQAELGAWDDPATELNEFEADPDRLGHREEYEELSEDKTITYLLKQECSID